MSSDSSEYDINHEVERDFNRMKYKQKKKQKPKLDLNNNSKLKYDSSDSDLSEEMSQRDRDTRPERNGSCHSDGQDAALSQSGELTQQQNEDQDKIDYGQFFQDKVNESIDIQSSQNIDPSPKTLTVNELKKRLDYSLLSPMAASPNSLQPLKAGQQPPS